MRLRKLNGYNVKGFIMLIVIMRMGCVEIKMFANNNKHDEINVYKDNKIGERFNFNIRDFSCCQRRYLYLDENKEDETNFIIKLTKNEQFDKSKVTVCLIDNNNISVKNNVFIEIEEDKDNNYIFNMKIFKVCQLKKANYESNIINVTFYDNEKYQSFFFMKKCFNREKSPPFLKRVIITGGILGISFIIIYTCSKFYYIDKHIDAKNTKTTIHKQGIIIEWYYGLAAFLVSIIAVYLTKVFSFLIWKIFNFASLTIVIPFILFVLFIILFKKVIKYEKFPEKGRKILKQLFITIKIYRLISIILSLLSIALFYYINNWLISNFYFTGGILVLVSKFYFENFSSVILFNACFIIYDLFWGLISIFYSHNFNSTSLEIAVQIFKITLPDFFLYDPNHPCIYISWIDITMICLILKYAKSFDIMKNDEKRKYFRLSVFIMVSGLIIVGLGEILIYAKQIYLFPVEVVLIIGLVVVASYFGEFGDFWVGKNNIGMMNEVNDIIKTVDRIDEEKEEINMKNMA